MKHMSTAEYSEALKVFGHIGAKEKFAGAVGES